MVASFVKGYQRQNMCKLREKCLSITTDKKQNMKIKNKRTNGNMSLKEEMTLRQAHDCSIRNKRQLEQSKLCGCFSCCEIFPPSEITDYISDKEPTAECPYCHIDAVIGDASGFPITEEFLRKMMYRWFW